MPIETISKMKKTVMRQPAPISSTVVLLFLSLFAFWLSPIGNVSAQESFAPFKPKSSKVGSFGKAFNLLGFESNGSKLKPTFEENPKAAQRKLSPIRRAINSRSSSSTSSNSNWWSTIQGQKCTASIGFGHSMSSEMSGENQFWVQFNDASDNAAQIRMKARKDGTISIDFISNNGSDLFRFRQEPKGKVYCQDFSGKVAFSTEAKSYDQFCQNHPEFIRNRLEPIFKHIGVGVPPSRYANEIAKNVLFNLQPVDDKRMKEFQLAMEGLDAQSFADREAAMKSLEEKFDQWRDLIQLTIDDDSLSVEIRTRLKKIYKTKATKQEVGDLEIVKSGKLEGDPVYLIWLFEKIEDGEQTASDETKQLLIKKIETLTGENHGADLKKWQSWAGDKLGKPKSAESTPTISDKEILALDGPLEQISSHIGNLIRLQTDESGDLEIDRKHWAKPFGGKTIKELTSEIEAQIKQSNLPTLWFDPGGEFGIESSHYPQVLFELLAQDHHQRKTAFRRGLGRQHNAKKQNYDRQFQGKDVDGEMRYVPLGPVRFSFNEKGKQKRRFSFTQSNSSTVIVIEFPNKDAMIRIAQTKDDDSPNRFSIFDIRGPSVKVYREKSYSDFKSKQKKYCENLLMPLLKKLKIEIGEKAK